MLRHIAEEYHNYLLQTEKLLEYLFNERGLTIDTIKKYKIGYSLLKNRYSIPIPDVAKSIVNIRLYKPHVDEMKMISYAEGTGEARLFPIENFKNSKMICLCEGEWDSLLLDQNSWNAMTNTCGASTWKKEWNNYFSYHKIETVITLYDRDDAGEYGSRKVIESLKDIVPVIKKIELDMPFQKKHGYDITDWYVKFKRTDEELQKLVLATKEFDLYKLVSLQESLNANLYNSKIKFYGTIMGKDLSPYIIPVKVKATCKRNADTGKKICDSCPIYNAPVTAEFTYENNKDLLIQMIKSNDMQLIGYIRQAMKIPAGRQCPGIWHIDVLDRVNVEEIIVVPELDNALIDERVYVQRTAYYFGYDIQVNQSHLFKGTTWSDPTSQMGIHLIEDAQSSKDDISKFLMDDDLKNKLKLFQPEYQSSVESINKKIKEIHKDLFLNVTKMWKRENILFALDLVYHSVLSFKFMDGMVNKGWLECTIVGDTRCGKTETVKKIVQHYRAGEFVTSGEHTTEAGLLGGLQQTRRGSWHITWGKLVMNNKRAVVLDEADELSKKGIIGLMSGVRSSGIAELVKIQSQRAQAQTRLIFISNPLWGRMSEHNFGIEVVREIFKAPQDISRIDFAIGISEEDVDKKLINAVIEEKVEHKFTSDLCNLSVMFAWSRKPENIFFEKEAIDFILEVSNKMGDDFSSDIPIVIGAEMRIKLARMAVAIACWMYSTDETGENIIVKQSHVLVVVNFLYTEYCGSVLGYKDFSDQKNRDKTIGNTDDIENRIMDKEMCDLLLDMGKIHPSDIEDVFGLTLSEARDLIGYLRKNKLIKRKGTFYVKTPGFIKYLKELKNNMDKKDKDIDVSKVEEFFK